MGEERFSEQWQNEEVTINRREYADVVCRETALVLQAVAQVAGKDSAEYEMFKDLLLTFCAGIGAQLFPEISELKVGDEDVED